MLYSLDGTEITDIPKKRREDFERWRDNLSDVNYKAVVDALKAHMDAKEVEVSSFIPGSDWTNTVYQPLYMACGRSAQQAGWFFGLILWKVMIEHPYKWYFMNTETEADDVLGKTYFRKQD